jgi:type IV secretion system protein VirB10
MMTIEPQPDSVTAVARGKTHLSGRQRLVGLALVTVILITIIFGSHLLNLFGKSGQKEMAEALPGPGMPFSRPIEQPTPAPSRPLPMPVAAPILPHLMPAPATNAKDETLTSSLFSYGAPAESEAVGALANKAASADQGAKDELSALLTHSDIGGAARARLMPHPSLTIPAGTIIPCVLQTGINSQLQGFVDCLIPSEVRSATGTVTLFDRGTQVMGEIRTGLRQGQDRVMILWVRARTPDNVIITLDSPAADELGRAGVPGAVDNHFLQRFGAAILFSLIDYGPYLASSALQHGNNNSYVSFLSPQQQVANTVLENTINIPPTLEKNQGETVSIFVARDLDFSGVYDLRASQ